MTPPAAVPVLVDWLAHVDERVPGPETQHRAMTRRSLLWDLRNVKATGGNRGAVDAIFQQLDRTSPPVEEATRIWSAEHLARIADASDYDRMVALYERPGVDAGIKVAVAMYVGRYKRPRSREIALEVIAADWVGRPDAIRALAKVGKPVDAEVIARYADDPNPSTRRAVATALTKLRP